MHDELPAASDPVSPAAAASPPPSDVAAPLTSSGPNVPRPGPDGGPRAGSAAPVRRRAAVSPAGSPSLGDQTAFRHAIAGPTGMGRARAFLVIAVAAGVPLALGMVGSPSDPDPFIATQLTPPTHGSTAPDGSFMPPAATAPSLPAGSAGPPGTPGPPGSPSTTTGQPVVAGAPPTGAGSPASPSAPVQPSTDPSKAADQGAAGVHVALEAEGSAADWSGPTQERDLAEASGGVVVGSTDQGLAGVVFYQGASVKFSGITVPESGEYTVTFYYATPENRKAVVSANGRDRATLSFSATGDGGTDIGWRSISAQLNAGSNTIEFGNQSAPIPDLDRIVVTSGD